MPSKKDKLGMDADMPVSIPLFILDHRIMADGAITCSYYAERVDADGNDAGTRQGDMLPRFTASMTNAQKKLIEGSLALFIAGEP